MRYRLLWDSEHGYGRLSTNYAEQYDPLERLRDTSATRCVVADLLEATAEPVRLVAYERTAGGRRRQAIPGRH